MKAWYAGAAFALFVLLFASCGERQPDANHWTPDLESHIVQYTSGVISAEEEIVVRFSQDLGLNMVPGTPASASLFEFDPPVEGQSVWKSGDAVAFIPKARFASGQEYQARFFLGKVAEVAPGMRTFSFDFATIDQQFEVSGYKLDGHSDRNLRWNRLEGTLNSNDLSSIEDVATRITVEGIEAERIQWSCPGDRHVWHFAVDSVERTAKPQEVGLEWDGAAFGSLTIPPLNDFSLLSAQVSQLPDQKITLTFSSPIRENQRMLGLFQFDGEDLQDVRVDGSTVVCHPSKQLNGEVVLRIAEGLENVLGVGLPTSVVRGFNFTVNKPAVQFIGDGNIVPTEGSAQIPFSAVGLHAVDVLIHEVLERNTHQFFQDNALAGQNRLRRVARPVVQRRIELGTAATHRWENYAIDLGELVERAPGAIYHVEIGFRPSYANYPCEDGLPEDGKGWGYDADVFSAYRSSHSPGYRYRERDNPCDLSYYGARRTIRKNVLVSDVGLVVKGSDSGWRGYVTHLTKGAVLPGATVELMNYQGQVVAQGVSDADGAVDLEADGGTSFLADAEWNQQKAYVKLENALSLSVSAFDVQGVDVKEGVQCMLYAERGVWRPGDTVFLDAILDDRQNRLPPDYPMVFTVRNPKGAEVIRRVVQRGDEVIHPFHFQTGEEDPTGTWLAELAIGSAKFVRSIAVETIQPNRLDISLSSDLDIIDATDQQVELSLRSEWLTGAKAGGLKYAISGRLRQDTKTLREAHPGFRFFDITKKVGSLSGSRLEGTLDANGVSDLSWSTGYLGNQPGPLELVAGTKVYEPGGRFSIATHEFKLSPFSAYVGFRMPEANGYGYWTTESDQEIEVLRVDASGAPKAGAVKVEVFRLDWNWWWRQGRNEVSRLSNGIEESLLVERIELRNGRGAFKLNVSDDDWGRIYIRVSDEDGGHASSDMFLFDWSYGRRASRGDQSDAASEILSLTLDQDAYEVGDVAAIDVPSAAGGTLILSVENGGGQVTDKVVSTAAGSTRVELELGPEMAPHCYVHAMVVQPHGDSGNDRPIRMYGIVPVEVQDPASLLEPVLNLPDEIEPNSALRIEVEEAQGVAMEYTLAVVDEGLLGLTRFRTPDPHSFFTRRSALGVRTWDMYAWVLEAFAGKIAKVLSVGGDGSVSSESLEDADRFRPVVTHLGPFQLKAGKRAQHEVEIKNYLGNVRVMVMAANADIATGSAVANVRVKQDLMVQLTVPRMAAPGERVDVPVTVFAMEDGIGEVDVSISESEGVTWSTKRKSVTLSAEGQKTVYFPGTVQAGASQMRVEVMAEARQMEAKDVVALPVRNPMPRVRQSEGHIVTESLSTSVGPFGIADTRTCNISVSSVPDLQLESRIKGLVGYPHGCTEQVTSQGLAQLHLDKWMSLSPERKADTKAHITSALNMLAKRQHPGGGFVYWPGHSHPNTWASSYVGHFLLHAKEAGYMLPPSMLNRYIQYERKRARNWSYDEARPWEMFGQAYRLMVLAEHGEAEVGAMTRLRNLGFLDDRSAMLLASAYADLGELEMAQKLLKVKDPDVLGDMRHSWHSFGSGFRNRAMHLAAMHKAGMKEEAMLGALSLSEEMGKGWRSTQDIAYGLTVLTEIFGGEATGPLEVELRLGDQTKVLYGSDRVLSWDAEALLDTVGLSIEHAHDVPVYVSVSQTAVEQFGEEVSRSDGLSLSVRHVDPQGQPLEVDDLKAGTVFYAEVSASRTDNGIRTERMALSYIIPAGWELSNARMAGGSTPAEVQYQDIRDDRVNSYFNLGPGKSVSLRFELVATYPGKYYAPPTYGEAMYNGRVQASTQGRWVTVQTP